MWKENSENAGFPICIILVRVCEKHEFLFSQSFIDLLSNTQENMNSYIMFSKSWTIYLVFNYFVI